MDPPITIDAFPEVQPYAGNTDENQRFTTRAAVAWCQAMARVARYDLDAAACVESHHAHVFYDGSPARNGLVEPWFGDTFINPPWSDIDPWVLKAWRVFTAPAVQHRDARGLRALTSVSMLLPGNRTHRCWWQEYVEPFRDGRRSRDADFLLGEEQPARLTTYCPPERFAYGCPSNPLAIGMPEPNFTSVLLIWRPRPASSRDRKLRINDCGGCLHCNGTEEA
jgi:hypothetical protein